jgi:chromosome segregation ATPase
MGNLSAAAGEMPQESEAAPDSGEAGSLARRQLEQVLAELEQERFAREKAELQLEQVRGELAESGEKLGEFYNRVKRVEQEKQLYMSRYEALREKHTDQLQSLTEELGQERQQCLKLGKQLKNMESECDTLRRALGSEQERSEAKHAALPGKTALPVEGSLCLQEDALSIASLEGGLTGARVETVHLKSILLKVAGEKQQLEDQLQNFAEVLGALHQSLHGITVKLSDIPAVSAGQQECVAMPEGGCDIEK